MNIIETDIPEVVIIEPKVFEDDRGYFFESYNEAKFLDQIKKVNFIQDNESMSSYGTLRGLHYQKKKFAQSKLVRVIKGKVLDIVLDIRKGSPTFMKHVVIELSEQNKMQVFIPRGFAHGFVVLEDNTIFSYKVDNSYSPENDRGILFSDPSLNIDWKVPQEDILTSVKDQNLPLLKDAELFDYSENLYL